MAVIVERMPNEPIIVVTLSGELDSATVRDMFARTARLIDEIGGPVYRITDVRLTQITAAKLAQVLADSAPPLAGSRHDARVRGMVVGGHGAADLLAESLKQVPWGCEDIPIFETLRSALNYIRAQMGLD